MTSDRLPKSVKALEKAYQHCQQKNKFRTVEKEQFHEYVIRSQKDISSAENDFTNEDYYWARIKAYQALFHMLNALVIKHLGYYSKDHSCILTALLKNNLITPNIASQMQIIVTTIPQKNITTSEDALQDIDNFRIQRNFALYKPKAWKEVTKQDIREELDKIKNNLKILVSIL